MKKWPAYPVIYEINTWVWITELSERYGRPITLDNVPVNEWDDIAELNVDAVWLMGVWQRSPAGREIALMNQNNLNDFHRALPDFSPDDAAGSPYCIRNWIVDEYFGGDEGLEGARSQLAERGILLILDFVPNHLAPDHPWIFDHPDFFIQGDEKDIEEDPANYCRIGERIFACGKDPGYPAWQDVVQVNAFHMAFRSAIIAELKKIAARCDGLRCDMAMLLLYDVFSKTWKRRTGDAPETDFWCEMIPPVKAAFPGFLFIAEVYWELEWDLQQQGFDFCYDKRLYDRLAGSGAPEILAHLGADLAYQDRLIRFTENHDEPRSAFTFTGDKSMAAAVACLTLPGAKLLYEGQLEGRKVKLPVFLKRRSLEIPDDRMKDFYRKLLGIIRDPSFQLGTWQLHECYGWPDNLNYRNLLAWEWKYEKVRYLVVINYHDKDSQGLIHFYPERQDVTEWFFDDVMTGSRYVRSREELGSLGLYIGLPGWGYHIFRIIPG